MFKYLVPSCWYLLEKFTRKCVTGADFEVSKSCASPALSVFLASSSSREPSDSAPATVAVICMPQPYWPLVPLELQASNPSFPKLPWLCYFNRTIQEELIRKSVDARGWIIAVTDLIMLGFVGMWKILGLWVRNVTEHGKSKLVGHPNRSWEDSRAESLVVCGGPVSEVSEGNCSRDRFKTWLLSDCVLRTCLRLSLKVMD